MEQTSLIGSIESYFPLVDKIVHFEMRKLSIRRAMFEEIRSFAMEGLVVAAKAFDAARGVPFENYAGKRIRWSIYDGLRTAGWFPRRYIKKMKFLKKAEEMMEADALNPAPLDKKDATHRFHNIINDLAAAYVICYIENEPWNEHSVEAESDELVDQKRFCSAMRLYIQSLPEKERMVINRHFYQDQRLIDIAQDMKVTISWVSKILSSGLRHLQEMSERFDDSQVTLDKL